MFQKFFPKCYNHRTNQSQIMPTLLFGEACFTLYSLSTPHRYYRIALKTTKGRGQWRWWELGMVTVNSVYFFILHVVFLKRPISEWGQVALFDFVSIFDTVFYFEFVVLFYLALSITFLLVFFAKPYALFTEKWFLHISKSDKIQVENQWRRRLNSYCKHQERLLKIRKFCHLAVQFVHLCQAAICTYSISHSD